MTPDEKPIQLRLHNAPSGCWERIMLRLEEEDILDTNLSALPTHHAPEAWAAIEASIATRQRAYILTLRAAAVAVIGLAAWIISMTYGETQATVVSTEIASVDVGVDHTDVSTNAIKLIRNASAQTESLQTNAAFREMLNDFDMLEGEQSKLEKEIERNGAVPELIKARVELENRKAQAAKNLIRLIML